MRTRIIRSSAPPASSMRRYRQLDTGPRIPPPMKMAIAAGCITIGLVTILIGSGLLVDAAGQLGGAFHDAVERLTSHAPATLGPSGVVLDTPVFDTPANDGYTNEKKLHLQGTVPAATVAKTGYKVRIFSLGDNNKQTLVTEVAVGGTTRFTTGEITLAEGPNTYACLLIGPGGEGGLSPRVTYNLDTSAPKITVTSPASNATINSGSATVTGKTDPGIRVAIRNEMSTGGGVDSATTGDDGGFSLIVPIVAGPNTLDLSAIDKAGNTGTLTITVNRSYGQLAAHLTATPTRFSSSAQTKLKLVVRASAVNGGPLANASVTFTVTVAGLGPIVSPELTTDGTGTASWQVEITGAQSGNGQVSVMVTSPAGDVVKSTVELLTT